MVVLALVQSRECNQFFDFNPWVVSICLYITFSVAVKKQTSQAYIHKTAPNMGPFRYMFSLRTALRLLCVFYLSELIAYLTLNSSDPYTDLEEFALSSIQIKPCKSIKIPILGTCATIRGRVYVIIETACCGLRWNS